MKSLLKKLFPSVYTNKSKLLKAIHDFSHNYRLDYGNEFEEIRFEIEYYDGWIDLDFTIERTANPFRDPVYADRIEETIIGIDIVVYDQDANEVEHNLTYQEIYNAIKHLVNN